MVRAEALQQIRWIELGDNYPTRDEITADLLEAFGDRIHWSRRWAQGAFRM
jgi:hypothetical protein